VLGCLRMRHILGERTNSLYLLSAGVSFPPLILPSPFPVGPAHTIPKESHCYSRRLPAPRTRPVPDESRGYSRRLPAPRTYLKRVLATPAVYPPRPGPEWGWGGCSRPTVPSICITRALW